MGNYRYIIAGDKCDSCKIGYIERVVVPPTGAETVFCLVTLGLGGDGGSQYYRCSHCKKEEYSSKVWDESLPEDKPRTREEIVKDIITTVVILLTVFFILLIITIIPLIWGYVIGWMANG